jgi:lipopolysaccharide/colanic/teichoic acid biosynthesis glycosyltransferase
MRFPVSTKNTQATYSDVSRRLLKRILDLSGSLLGMILASPILVLAAIAIKLDSSGPVIYSQVRIGLKGIPFRMYKLRTMVVGAESQVAKVLATNPLQGPVFKIPDDPRVTKVGRFLRRWSVDELPQLWNVLRGEMSLVGPRPEESWVVAQYDDAQRMRLMVKPGLTGPMQVSGRGDLGMDERLELEIAYIQNCSIREDVRILIQSLPAILSGKGAY